MKSGALFATTILTIGFFGASAAAQTVSIGTQPQGAMGYTVGAGIARVAKDAANLRGRVVPQGGAIATLPLLGRGELDFAVVAAPSIAFALAGKGQFKGKPIESLRAVAIAIPLYLGIMVPQASPVTTIADLKGKRLSGGFARQKMTFFLQLGTLATAGLGRDDFSPVPTPTFARASQDFMSGRVDALLAALQSGAARQAQASLGGVRVLDTPNSPRALAALRKFAPGTLIEKVEPRQGLVGVSKATNLVVVPFVLTASAKTPSDLVYKVAKAMHDNKKALVSVNQAFNGFDPRKMNADLGIPYHEGALKYYREIGQLK